MSRPRILVLHGPNLNLLGQRETGIYGTVTLAEIDRQLQALAEELGAELRIHQSNHEGELVDLIHESRGWAPSIVLHPSALPHCRLSPHDALTAVSLPAVEVHLPSLHAQVTFRHQSVIAPAATGQIAGFGPDSYLLGLRAALAAIGERDDG